MDWNRVYDPGTICRSILEVLNDTYPQPVQFGYIAARVKERCKKLFSDTTISAGLILLADRGEILGEVIERGIDYRITPAGKKRLITPDPCSPRL